MMSTKYCFLPSHIGQKILALLILFLSMASVQAQISFDNSDTNLTIRFNNTQRLMNGIGLIENNQKGSIKSVVKNDVILLQLEVADTVAADKYAGVFFSNIPQLKHAIALWRYKPWNSWTKPVAITEATQMEDWDVQFFYWQYADGLYGAAVPLSGNGFRTTLGSAGNTWGSKAVSYAGNNNKDIPAMAISFGKDPYELFARLYKTALEAMGKSDNEFAKKILPQPLQYIGWCTWNSSNMGNDLNEEHILEGVKTFTDKHFPLGWVLIDDGWFQHRNSQLQSLMPDPKKFPNGFKPLLQKLKTQYGIKYAGVWHAFDGYWNGIDPESSLGKKYHDELFYWKQKEKVDVDTSATATYAFIKPEGDNLFRFYDTLHRYLKSEGFDFIKVDNQLVAERMAANNYPLFSLSQNMHEALYRSANKNFNGAIINCMDMTADAYLNFGSSATARTVEDYFPYQPDETYNLQRGNAAAHVLQAIYNSVYFSQMVFTDYDMFQSHNPNAVMHALARTLNNGPIYLTDKPGEQNFTLLDKIVYSDGRSIRSETSLLPADDCLFQVQDASLFKAFSKVRNAGLLALFNLADADSVSGYYKPADADGVNGNEFAVYDYFSGKFRLAKRNDSFRITLPRMGYEMAYIVPVTHNFAALGLINKYNAPATILNETWSSSSVSVQVYEGGTFKAYSKTKPAHILVNNKEQPFSYHSNIISLEVSKPLKKPVVHISW